MSFRTMAAVGLAAVAALLLLPSPAGADHGDLSLPIGTVVRGSEGDVVLLVSETVEPDLVGATCSWDFHSHNQSSVHPGNDLILATGGEQWVLAGVEDTAGGELALTGSFRLGET
jgi:hypothetical protein